MIHIISGLTIGHAGDFEVDGNCPQAARTRIVESFADVEESVRKVAGQAGTEAC
jgi:hypothetical protein